MLAPDFFDDLAETEYQILDTVTMANRQSTTEMTIRLATS
jgi:hypothetical protein